MPNYTIEHLRTLARGKDNRLADKNKYTDEWIDDKIDHAFETCQSGRQVFVLEEVIDMKPFAADGVEKFVLEPDEEVDAYLDIVPSDDSITGKLENDNRLSITIDVDKINATEEDVNLKIKYFYFPHIPFDSIFMASNIYHFWRHCLYVNIYGALRDKENELYHQEQVDTFIREGTFTMPNDFDEYIELNPNFQTTMRF